MGISSQQIDKGDPKYHWILLKIWYVIEFSDGGC